MTNSFTTADVISTTPLPRGQHWLYEPYQILLGVVHSVVRTLHAWR